MQAEVPQPISTLPTRWGSFTGVQLFWLGAGALPPYLLLRARLPLVLVLVVAAVSVGAGAILAFGHREGRRLDGWLLDWLQFQFQVRQLAHPGHDRRYHLVDIPREEPHSPLPWRAP